METLLIFLVLTVIAYGIKSIAEHIYSFFDNHVIVVCRHGMSRDQVERIREIVSNEIDSE